MEIPKIIHQIWSNKYFPLPNAFVKLSQTWKELHPNWQYIFWDDIKIANFIEMNFPQYLNSYHSFSYDIQRWDAIRYLILYKMGGLYVDFDYECLENIEPLLLKNCCFAMEPEGHVFIKEHEGKYFNNALMASIPNHPFMEKVIERVFDNNRLEEDIIDKKTRVLLSTGPLMLTSLYMENPDYNVYLIPSEYVSPFTKMESLMLLNGQYSEMLEKVLEKAYAVHYFLGTWTQ